MKLYTGFIRPCLEFCSQFWGSSPYTSLLDRIASKAFCLIADLLTSTLDPLSLRCKVASLFLFCRYYFGHLQWLGHVPHGRHHLPTTIVWNSNAGINRFSDGFFPSTSCLWNSLPSFVFPASFNLPSKGMSITTLGTRWHDFFITLRYFINLFYSLHCLSFSFSWGCRLEKGHIVPVLCSIHKRKIHMHTHTCTSPLHDSHLHWVYDPQPRQTPSVPPRHSPSSPVNPPVPRINDSVSRSTNSVPRINKTVPRNVYPPPRKESTAISIAPSSDVRVRAPFTRIESSTWENSSQKICPPVPRNNMTDSDGHTVPPPQKRKRNRVNRRERRAREREERALIEEAFNHDARWNFQSPGALSSTTIPDPLTTIGLPHSEPISAMRPAVYLPVTEQGRPVANENSSSLFGQELRESVGLPPGLYKAPDPDPQHHFRNSSWACSSEDDPPSPTRTSRACSSGARPRTGIIYPLQPRQRRPDTHITVEAASLPEPAALHREELLPVREVPTDLPRPSQRPGRKRRRKRSSALYRPAKRSPPRGRWCIL